MAGIWCEGEGEFRRFPAEEFRHYGGVEVHAVGSWHLTNGDVIDMEGEDAPSLVGDRPVVAVGELTATDAESYQVSYGGFDAAPGDGSAPDV